MSNPTTQRADQQDMGNPVFFLSHASKDRQSRDHYLRTFFQDMLREMRTELGINSERIGFMDVESIITGEDWEHKITHDLNHSEILICAYSPFFFQSEYCGKEFGVFLERNPNVTIEDGSFICNNGQFFIVPIYWESEESLDDAGYPPKHLRRIQIHTFDQAFAQGAKLNESEKRKTCLKRIIKCYGPQAIIYQKFKFSLIDAIKQIRRPGRRLPPLESQPTFQETKNVFEGISDSTNTRKGPSYVLPEPGSGLRIFLLTYFALLGDNKFTCESLAHCLISRDHDDLFLQSGKRDTIRPQIEYVATKHRFKCEELLANSPSGFVAQDIREVLRIAYEINTLVVMVLGDQAMPQEDMNQLQRDIQENSPFCIILNLFEHERISEDFRTLLNALSTRIKFEELDTNKLAGYQDAIVQKLDPCISLLMKSIATLGNVQRKHGSSGSGRRPKLLTRQ